MQWKQCVSTILITADLSYQHNSRLNAYRILKFSCRITNFLKVRYMICENPWKIQGLWLKLIIVFKNFPFLNFLQIKSGSWAESVSGTGSGTPDPGWKSTGSRIRIHNKEFMYLKPKMMLLSSRKYEPGCLSRIPGSGSWIQVSKSTGSGIRIHNTSKNIVVLLNHALLFHQLISTYMSTDRVSFDKNRTPEF
jgi:hypothetical protein